MRIVSSHTVPEPVEGHPTTGGFARSAIGVLAAFALVFVAAPAHADTTDTQAEVDRVIAAHGGTQTAWNEVSWNDGETVLTIAATDGPGVFSVGPCAAGKYCVYSGAGYTGSILTFSSCTTGNSVAALPQVRSIANSRTAGTVRAYNGSTLVTTVAPNTGNVLISGTVKTVSCS